MSDEQNKTGKKPAEAVDTGRRIEVKTTRRQVGETTVSKTPKNGRPHRNGQNKHKQPNGHSKVLKASASKEPTPIQVKPPRELVRQEVPVVPAKPVVPVLVRPEPVEFDDTGDFAAMLNEFGPISRETVEIGSKVRGKVVHISHDSVFVSLGQRLEGSFNLSEFCDEEGEPHAQKGDVLEGFVISVEDGIRISKKLGINQVDMGMLEDARAHAIPIEGKITAVNKGGLEVSIAGAKAFCPIGQVSLDFIEDASSLVGTTQVFLITQISANGRNVVVSRKTLLERERQQKQKERLASLEIGDVVTGKISRTAEFGAFVDLDGIEGLIPVSQLSHSRSVKVDEVVKVGDQVQVEVMKIEPDPKRAHQMRIGLSLKAALPDPYEEHGMSVYAGAMLPGKVTKLENFGAFVELFPGVEGLVHISEMSSKRIRHPEEIVKIGDVVQVRVLDVDFASRRISLSLDSKRNLCRQRQKNKHQKKKVTM